MGGFWATRAATNGIGGRLPRFWASVGRMVLFTWPGRGRLEVRWTLAVSNPRRATVPVEEQVRRNLVNEVHAGRMEPEYAAERYGRFLERHRSRLQ